MKERPILFSDAMVRAVLDGRKTQTRRTVKPQSLVNADGSFNVKAITPSQWRRAKRELPESIGFHYVCPYGKPGDRLWVREAWRTEPAHDHLKPSEIPVGAPILTMADTGVSFPSSLWGKYRHARFMPRWTSRILLEVTGVRVERVQNISKADAFAEGVTRRANLYSMDWSEVGLPCGAKTADWQRSIVTEQYIGNDNPVGAFATYLEKVSGEDSWDSNPWVWVIQFKRTTA